MGNSKKQDIGSRHKKINLLRMMVDKGFRYPGDGKDLSDDVKLHTISRKIPWSLLESILHTIKSEEYDIDENWSTEETVTICNTFVVNVDLSEIHWSDSIVTSFHMNKHTKTTKTPVKVTKEHIVSCCKDVFGAYLLDIKFPPTINYTIPWFICVLCMLSRVFLTEAKNPVLIENAHKSLQQMRRTGTIISNA
jgi:hypothetical protein